MEDFLKPIFEFMEGNFIILNMLILYGIPTLVWIIGFFLQYLQNKFVNVIGILLILISVASCVLLGISALKHGIIFTGICGFVWAGAILYYSFFDTTLMEDNKIDIDKKTEESKINLNKKAKEGNADAYIALGKECFITDKNAAAQYFLKAAEKGNPEAQYRLGRVYYEFLDKKEEGIKWLKMSASQNYQDAVEKLNNIIKKL
jgi:tetratricopeptide (TPR) repeat protein